MNKHFKPLVLFATLFLASPLALGAATTSSHQEIEPDEVLYDDPSVVAFDQMKPVASAETPDVKSVVLHYHNDDGACGKDTTSTGSAGGRAFYIWSTGVPGKEYMPDTVSPSGQDMNLSLDFTSEKFSAFYGKSKMMLIIKYRASPTDENWSGQSSDTEIVYANYGVDSAGKLELWTMPGSGSDLAIFLTEAATKVCGVTAAKFTDWKTIACTNTAESVTYDLYAFDATYWKVDATSRSSIEKWYLIAHGEGSGASFNITLPHSAHINIVYSLVSLDSKSTTGLTKTATVSFDPLYDDERFETFYTYDGNDLGVKYTSSQSSFKVWAPTAGLVTLRVYTNGTPSELGGNDSFKAYNMAYTGHGVWSLTVTGMLLSYYYTYLVSNSAGTNEIVDPYATACGVNGRRGMIYDKSYSNPEGWNDLPLVWDGVPGYDIKTPQELSIYEVHVQDFTGDSSWNGAEKKGTYKAFVEPGTRLASDANVTTGYDHLNELGVNAIQLMPVFDHDNDETKANSYNWGYNPLNYNCVEGVYSSDPYNGMVRIKEYKNLVLQMSKTAAHTRVIMDVVYNHVSSASASNLSKLMPKYFFRYTYTGEYANGSGCNNEIRSEATMMRKFIVDSVSMWATEYKVKGFRFDLMGLIDTITMAKVKEALYAIDPDIYVYGEGWSAGGYHGKEGTKGADSGNVYGSLFASTTSPGAVGCFNDAGRNALRGDNEPGYGYMQQGPADASAQNATTLAEMLWGIHSGCGANPTQTVNYASCHDNWTLFDQFYATLGDGTNAPSLSTVCDASLAATSMIMVSNAASFILGGEELFRTKTIDPSLLSEVAPSTYEEVYGKKISHNSYNAPLAVNAFKWGNKKSIDGTDTSAYCAKFAEVIKLHATMDKYPYVDGNFPYTTTSAGNPVSNIYWAGHSGSSLYNGGCGFQLDEYFIFLGGRNFSYISFGDMNKCGDPLFASGTWAYDGINKTVNLGRADTNVGGAFAIFRRGA